LRFAITSPPSGCEEDFHLPAVEHARHTEKGQLLSWPFVLKISLSTSGTELRH
jgi:hypothetical protein